MDNGIIYTDKVGLEEIIEHKAGFAIIDGYYYNEGRNDTINHVIKDLYDLRKKSKQENNPAQVAIRLLMNSMCGRLLLNQWKQILL